MWTMGFSWIASNLILEYQILHLIELNRTSLTEPSVSLWTEFYGIFSILNLEFHKGAVLGHYYFFFMLASFLRSSNLIFLISIVMQMIRNCTFCLDQEMI